MSTGTDSGAAPPAASRPPDSPGEARASSGPPPLVFVGGTGRSGTHVIARLLAHHSRYAEVPIECRFHVNPQGFPDLLAGRVSARDFLRKLRRFWWYRIKAGEPLPAVLPRLPLGRETRGLHQVVPRERFDAALERFERAYPGDPERACRALFLDLLWPLAEERGKPGLVEMSCFTVAQAPTLVRLFPEAKLVHTVRDGRDAGASKVTKRQKPEHPRDARQGIEWWLGRLSDAEAGQRAVAADRILTVSLDELAYGEREEAYRELLGFLAIEDEPAMREFFDSHVNAANAHPERWREGLGEAGQREVSAEYERALRRLEEQGAASAPLLRRVYERGA